MAGNVQHPEAARLAWSAHGAAAALIVSITVLRLLYLALYCPLDLAPDESHYWDWSRQLDWSYYSKGPLVAVLIRLSCELFGPWSQALVGSEVLAVRLPAVLCGALLLTSLYILTLQVFRQPRLGLAVLGVALTLPLFSAGALLMTIDAPFLCCWGWALVCACWAIQRDTVAAWLTTGCCLALGILAKHTMVLFVPMFGLFLLVTPGLRSHLLGMRFWLTASVGMLGSLPILLWNVHNDWVTLRHTQGHAGFQAAGLDLLGPLRYLGMQFIVLLGFWFIAWARALWAHRPGQEHRPEVGFLWWMSLPMIAFFVPFSLKNGGGEVNWPLAGYLSGLVLLVPWMIQELHSPTRWYRWLGRASLAGFCVLGLLLTILSLDTSLVRPVLVRLAGPATPERPVPLRRLDPTCRLRGWQTLAVELDRLRQRLRDDGEEPLLAAAGWHLCGEISFYSQGQPTVYSLGVALGDRHSQYDLWRPNPVADPDVFRGRTFLVVGVDGLALQAAFEQVEATYHVTHFEAGQPVASWPITIARGYRGFSLPFQPTAY